MRRVCKRRHAGAFQLSDCEGVRIGFLGCRLRILLLFLFCVFVAAQFVLEKPAVGQNALVANQSSVMDQTPDEPVQQSSAILPTGKKPEQLRKQEEEKKGRKKLDPNGSIVAAPLPIVSPALGAGIIPILGYITPIPARDKAITPSVFGAGGLITNNGSRGFGLAADLYLDQARYELDSVYAHGNLDYNLYGVGFANGDAGLKLPLEQAGQILFLKFLREIGWDTYVGIRFTNGTHSSHSNRLPARHPPSRQMWEVILISALLA
jgi:hypothetical protein